MRTEIYNYLKGLKFAGFNLSDELPWDASGQPLYIKNPKKIYVDNDQKSVETIIQALNGLNIRNETTTVSVYLTTDAKQKPSNYDAVITAIVAGKDSAAIDGKMSRECDVATAYTGDLMTTTLEFRFSKLI
jgi:hypothetical protein